MRILYATSVDLSVSDGPGVNEREFFHALCENSDVDVRAVVPQPAEAWPSELDGSAVAFTYRRDMRHPLHALRHQASQYLRLNNELRSGEYDLVVYRPYPFPVAALAALLHSRVPYALKNIGPTLVSAVRQHFPRASHVLAPVNHRMLRSLLERSVAADTVSDTQRTELLEMFPGLEGRLHVVNNAVNTDRFRPIERRAARRRLGLDRFDHIIGYAGNYPDQRGGRDIVSALPRLREQFPRIGALILGGGDDDKLRTYAAQLGVADICRITGRISFDDVPTHIAAFDVGVSMLHPSNAGAAEQKVRQYLAVGRPVVTTPGASAFVADVGAGTVVPYDDNLAFTQAVASWLSMSPDSWMSASHRASEYARNVLSTANQVRCRIDLWRTALSIPSQSGAG